MDTNVIPSQPRGRRSILQRSFQRLSNGPKTLYQLLDPLKDETRGIRLLAGSGSSRIKCSLFHMDLDNPPAYGALSYTWIEPSKALGHKLYGLSCTIMCNGVKVAVTPNLEAALRQLRSPLEDRILWIDALCINQADVQERNEQVKKMGLIYSKAEKVIVWLGEESDDSKLSFELARALNEKDADYVEWLFGQPEVGKFIDALISLFTREYWSRVWVIQETALARDIIVFCGDECIRWSYLDAIPTILTRHKERVWATLIESNEDYYGLFESGPTALHVYPDDPLMTLCVHRDKNASDSRDKIFALIGVIPSLNSPGLVNYSRSIEEIYREVVEIVVSHGKSLDIICARGEYSGLTPSWVPDWRIRAGCSSFTVQKIPYRAAGFSHPVVSFSKSTLTCCGFLVGLVDQTGTSSFGADSKSLAGFVHDFYKWFDFVYSFAPDTDATQEFFLRTIHLGEPRPEGEQYSRLEWRTSFLNNIVTLTRALKPDLAIDKRLKKYVTVVGLGRNPYQLMNMVNKKWILDVSYMMHGRRIFVSREGFIGLAPTLAEPGDLICILLGCSCPVMLRPKHDGYTLIGEVYVDGIMNGEAMNDLRNGFYRQQTFKIY